MIAAVMLVKDEADIIGHTIQHLLDEGVGRVYVMDNLSSDGTTEILAALEEATGAVHVIRDEEVGYWQDRKTTALAQLAWADGARWIVPCDADEIWQASTRGMTVAEVLTREGPDVQIVRAEILNHVPRGDDDPDEPNPVKRIEWRLAQAGALPKVACRAAADLEIHMGNHSASYREAPHALTVGGLTIHHFSWRSPEQYLRKIRNGEAAYAATDMPDTIGGHWRMFDGATDAAIREHYERWFVDPDSDCVYDPAIIGEA